MIYLQLFLSFLQIGLFSFGGGYAAMPLIQAQIVDAHGWLTMSEFTDLITISQMTPGPIAATIGCILPSCVIVTFLAKLYLKYRTMDLLQGVLNALRPAVVALIASAGVSILLTAFWGSEEKILLEETDWLLVVIFGLSFLLLDKAKMNPILVMILAGVMKVAAALIGGV